MPRKNLRLLFVTPYIPASIRLRPFHFISELAKKGHLITIVCLAQPKWEMNYLKDVTPFCTNIYPIMPNRLNSFVKALVSLPSLTPLSVAVSSSEKMHKVISELLQKSQFDVIHTEFIRAGQYTAGINGIPKLFDSVDSLTLAYYRAIMNKNTQFSHRVLAFEEWIKMRYYEPKILRSFNRAIVSSPSDQTYLAINEIPVDVIPNGVDLDYFQFNEQDKEENSIIFLGKMNYYVNVDSIIYFYHYIYPTIKKKCPKIQLNIVGYNPTRAVRSLNKDTSINVTGSVPDIRPYLRNATIAIAPMISGSGIQNKILEAMAIGTPVVTTSLACQALQVINGVHLIVADDPIDFAKAVIDLLNDKTLQQKIRENARRYVKEFHNWNVISQNLEGIYWEMLK